MKPSVTTKELLEPNGIKLSLAKGSVKNKSSIHDENLKDTVKADFL